MRHQVTRRTNNCCAMTFRLEKLSNDIATPPATAPATIECHRADLLRSQLWCACAMDESRAALFLTRRLSSGGSGSELQVIEPPSCDDDGDVTINRGTFGRKGTLAGKSRGNALRRIR